MPRAHWLRTAAVLCGLLAPAGAGAQPAAPPSDDGARAMVAEVRGWITRQFGAGVDATALPLKVVPDGETYRMELGIGGTFFSNGLTVADATMAATVKPLDGGRWAIVSAAMPASIRAEFRTPGGDATTTVAIGIGKQETTGTFDPSLTAPSIITTQISDYTAETRAPTGNQSSRIEKMTTRTEWQPAAPGRVTVQGDTTLEKYSAASPLPGGETMNVTIDRMTGATRIENLDMASLGGIMQTAFTLGSISKPAAKGEAKASNAQEKSLALALLTQIAGLLDAIDADYTYDGVTIDGGSLFKGSLRQFGFGMATASPDGTMGIRIKLAAEGLESPMIPDGPWRDFVPHRVTLTPMVRGVAKEALVAYLRRAIESDGADMEAETMRLLQGNPVLLGLDDVLIDLGPMRLTGEGAVKVASPDDIVGEAELRATGLDALIRRVNTVPELRVAGPVLIFLKGIGRQEGSETVWAITYSDRRLVVNDTDMSDLMPSK